MSRVGVEDLVHLLERFTHGLRAEEPDVETGKECEGAKEKEGAVFDVLKHGWGDETNNKVAQPVGASRNGDTLGSAT